MAALTLPGDQFSIVTVAERGARAPAWETMLGWPRTGPEHVELARERAAKRDPWAAKLDQAVLRADRAVLLVADGASCFATAWWARLSPSTYVSRVAGALLFDPPESAEESERAQRDFASPGIALPFPSLVIPGSARPGELHGHVSALAQGWGSRFLESDAGRRSRAGTLRHARIAIERWSAAVVARDLRMAEAFGLRLID